MKEPRRRNVKQALQRSLKPTHADEGFEYPEYAEFHLRHNPGHDFILFIRMLDKAPAKKFNQVFAAYARNPLGVIIASCAIEGYLHFVGHHVDPGWAKFIKKKNSIRDRIERIYALLKKPVHFGSGVMQQVIQLFQIRRELVHPQFQETIEDGSSPPPTVLDRVDADFPTAKSRQIVEDFRDTILRDSQTKDMWMRTGFVEKEKPAKFKRKI
jgi:hypothetical protein